MHNHDHGHDHGPCKNCGCKESKRRRWSRKPQPQRPEGIHEDVPHPRHGCEYQLSHETIRTTGTILTLVYHCKDGLVAFNEADSIENARKLSEEFMALYDIERVARAGA